MMVIAAFNQAARKVRVSSRAKVRLSVSEWDELCSYACIMCAVVAEAEKSGASESVLASLQKAMLQRQGLNSIHPFSAHFLDESCQVLLPAGTTRLMC